MSPRFTYRSFVKHIRQKHANDVVMVVGHRGTVPRVLAGLGCAESVALNFDEYDSLFILVPIPGSAPRLLHLRIP
jgi:hypothetical protein